MEKYCPLCNELFVKRGTSYVCTTRDCNFVCVTGTPAELGGANAVSDLQASHIASLCSSPTPRIRGSEPEIPGLKGSFGL